MVRSIVFGLLAGLSFGNGLPHFLEGQIGNEQPMPMGRSAVLNVMVGWVFIVVSGVLAACAGLDDDRPALAAGAAVGLLAIGLFHARVWKANPEFFRGGRKR